MGLQIARLESSRRVDVLAQRIKDPERDIALEDADRLRNSLQRGDERVFSVSLYLLLRAPTRGTLDEATRRVETQLDGLLTHSRVALFEQQRGLRSCLPEGRDRLLVPRNLDTSSLAISLPLASSSLVMERGVLYGVAAQSQSPIIIDPFDSSFDNNNLAVLAPSGSGKSYFIKLLALRLLVAGTEFLVIDPEDEYRPVAQAVGGLVIRLAASSTHRLNPLDLLVQDPSSPEEAADPLAQSIAVVLGRLELLLCAGAGPGGAPGVLDVYERAVLDQALCETYAVAGITADPPTHARPAPLLADLHTVLDEMDSEIADRLAVRLRRHIPGAGSLGAGVFAGATNVTLAQPFVVFHIRDLPKELWPLAIHLISSHVWNTARRVRRQRLLVVDEAAMLLAHPSGGAFLADVARRARKYYLGLVTIWQKVGDLTGSEHRETILTNSDMKLPGIPMLYAAFDRDTVAIEVAFPEPIKCAVASLVLLPPTNVLDLTRLPEIPSIFEAHERYLNGGDPMRAEIQFLYEFRQAISKPIARDDRIHVEYVPTQVITEYFRTVMKVRDESLDGVIYPSARHDGGANLVLFATQTNMVNDPLPAPETRAVSPVGLKIENWIAVAGTFEVVWISGSYVVHPSIRPRDANRQPHESV